MSNRPDRRRLTTWEQHPTPQTRFQHRWSTPTMPIASLVQPGYDDLGPCPPRPLRAPAYPLSSRPFLSQQTSTQRGPSYQASTQQTSFDQNPPRLTFPQQTSPQNLPQQASTQETSHPRLRLRKRIRRLSSRLLCLSPHENTQAQASLPTSPSPLSAISSSVPPRGAPVALEHPRPAPLPPPPPPALPPPPPSDQSLPGLPIPPPHAHVAHAPAKRRPLSVPPLLYGADPVAHDHHSRPSLQHGGFALCRGCSRARHCIIGLGGGRVLCTECLRQHFLNRRE